MKKAFQRAADVLNLLSLLSFPTRSCFPRIVAFRLSRSHFHLHPSQIKPRTALFHSNIKTRLKSNPTRPFLPSIQSHPSAFRQGERKASLTQVTPFSSINGRETLSLSSSLCLSFRFQCLRVFGGLESVYIELESILNSTVVSSSRNWDRFWGFWHFRQISKFSELVICERI